jgi:aromatic-L-amino-acid decarboxylase
VPGNSGRAWLLPHAVLPMPLWGAKTGPMPNPPKSQQDRRLELYDWSALNDSVEPLMHWIREYWAQPENRSVYEPQPPGKVLDALPQDMPVEPESPAAVLRDFESIIAPGLLHWNHPGFFGFFPCNTSGPAVAAATLGAAINVNPFSWNAGPSATELEMRLIEWLGRAIQLPWPGTFQDTASSATLCAVIAAREQTLRKIGARSLREAPQLTAYTSSEAHNSVSKAIHLAGLGHGALRVVATREDLSMDPEALRHAIVNDRQSGCMPFFVCSTLGTTSTTAFDDVAANCQAISNARSGAQSDAQSGLPIWHHVDAALAGTAALLPEMQWLMKGCLSADSFVFNPHKWLFTGFDCSVLLVKNREAYTSALSADAAYLQNHAPVAAPSSSQIPVEDFRNWSIQLGHGFRGLRLWFVLRCYGRARLESMIRAHLKMAQDLYGHLAQRREHFVTLAEPKLNTVCFRMHSEEATKRLHRLVTERGRVYLTPTVVKNTFWIRIALGQTGLLEQDVQALVDELDECARVVLG